MPGENCIILFVKYPEEKKVKTRLLQQLDNNFVIELYKCFVYDILSTIKKTKIQFKIFYTPSDALSKMKKWLENKYQYYPQVGNDLGEKMENAFKKTFLDGFSKAIIIGSDIPFIKEDIINEAFKIELKDAVIGPSVDGGYYLIGFKKETFLPDIFKNINWGMNNVYEKTIKIFKKNKYNLKFLPILRDIDRLEDLRTTFKENKEKDFSDSFTMKFLLNNQNRFL